MSTKSPLSKQIDDGQIQRLLNIDEYSLLSIWRISGLFSEDILKWGETLDSS
jgi:hypothetical protein